MKRPLYEIACYEALKAHCKTEALRHLIEANYKGSTSDRDQSVTAGVAYILEEISNQMKSVYQMLDVGGTSDLGLEFEDPQAYVKGYPLHDFQDLRKMLDNKNCKQ